MLTHEGGGTVAGCLVHPSSATVTSKSLRTNISTHQLRPETDAPRSAEQRELTER